MIIDENSSDRRTLPPRSGSDEIVTATLARTQHSIDLRQMTPFAGVLSDNEWSKALLTPDVVRSRAPAIDPRIDSHELATRVERLLGHPESP